MNIYHRIATSSALAAALVIGACQAPVETKPASKDLGEADLQAFAVGSEWLGLRNGKEHSTVLVSREGDVATFEASGGCRYTRTDNVFSPATKFTNCRGNTGSQTITGVEGSIWPLKIGNTQSWSLTGRNTAGNTWSTTRRCEVESAERITVPAGEFDAYKVVCKDSWRTRTWYYAPDVKSAVLFTNLHAKQNSFDKWELVASPASQ